MCVFMHVCMCVCVCVCQRAHVQARRRREPAHLDREAVLHGRVLRKEAVQLLQVALHLLVQVRAAAASDAGRPGLNHLRHFAAAGRRKKGQQLEWS